MVEVMDCLPCCQASKGQNITCIEEAIKKIKEHFLFFQKQAEKKQQQIKLLQERNEKLEEAVDILQKEQIESQNSCDRKASRTDANKSQFADEISFNCNEVSPVGHSDLNVAIHSANLLDASAFSCSSTQNETIAETESLNNSPCKPEVTRSIWKKRREQLRSQNKVEKNKPADDSLKRTDSWMTKERVSSPVAMLNESVTKQNSTTLRDLINIKNDKKINLSLNKNKVRQKRLTFERENSKKVILSEKQEEVIDSPAASSKQMKPARHLLARNDNCEDNLLNQSPNPTKKLALKKVEQESKIADDYLFDFNSSTTTPFKTKSPSKTSDSLYSLKLSLSNKANPSPSCVMLTPETQDIVFVDDETDDELPETSKHIKTMDLMADILKPNNDSLTNLKRLEIDGIKKQQREVTKKENKASNLNKTNVTSLAKKIKEEKVTQPPMDDGDTTFVDEAVLAQHLPFISKKREMEDTEDEDDEEVSNKAPKKVLKKDQVMSPKSRSPDTEMYSEDDEELFKMPLPMVIKEEKDTSDRKLTLKERFSIECEDCEKYLDIVGKRLTDKEIENILRNCKHGRDLMRSNTPEGFWNPLLLSFAEDDPRNEVLVDNRFVGKKRPS